jgi:lipoprotein-anchoring transpeptidase ErfK/SrfK
MRFNRGMGIHDASWRRDFGSQNYKWTGSHGCVNTPVDLMPKLYEWSEIGTRVLVF